MNHQHRSLWNDSLGAFVAAPEHAAARGKRSTGRTARRARSALAAAAALACAGLAQAGPQGGQVTAGSGSIAISNASPNASTTTITQTSPKLAINWQSFNTTANETVNFVQPGSSAVALNRVLGSDGTQFLGRLNANGQVFVINPNGVLFGKTAQVSVGGLVASTLNLSDSDFMAGKLRFTGNGGSVVNQGSLTAADGGHVALLGGQVSNSGTVSARLGSVALAAGSAVTLDFAGDGLLNVAVDQGALNALASNSGQISADGGSALLTAKAAGELIGTVVNNTGVIQARTLQNKAGVIKLLGDFGGGTVQVDGTLDASAPTGGDGGFVDTSGAKVLTADSAKVTTQAAAGKTGTWLIDPNDYTVGASGSISGATLSSNLANSSITLQSSGGNSAGSGNVNINDVVSWSANTLTLTAANNVNINAVMNVTGNAVLALNPATANGADAAVAGGTVNVAMGSGKVNINHQQGLRVNGTTYLIALNIADLSGINISPGGRYALGVDLDASSLSAFAPIGNATTPFTGVLDGLGHTISNLSINRPTEDNVGLIGRLGGTGQLRNLNLSNVLIDGRNNVGAAVGEGASGSVVQRVSVNGSVSGAQVVGGVVGRTAGSVSEGVNTASVTSRTTAAGGLAGFVDSTGQVSASSNAGAVSGQGGVGGLAGVLSGLIETSINSGEVRASGGGYNQSFGGLVGQAGDGGGPGTVRDAYSTGAVVGGTAIGVGGAVGVVSPGTVLNRIYSTGAVSSSGFVGGLVGGSSGALPTATASFWNTQTSGQSSSAVGTGLTTAQLQAALPTGFSSTVWGNAGNQSTPYLLSNPGPVLIKTDPSNAPYQIVLNAAQVQGINSALGKNYALGNSIDLGSIANFNPLGNATTSFIGQFDGLNFTVNNLSINRSGTGNVGLFGYNAGTVRNVGVVGGTVTGQGFVGGLVGNNAGVVSTAFATAAVSGNVAVGGLVGGNFGSINNAYATGAVSGSLVSIGGLVGSNPGTISNAFAMGAVSGGSNVGGLVGGSTGSVTNSYWNTQTTGQITSAGGGTGLTTAQLQAALPGGLSSSLWGNAGNQSTPYLLNNPGPALIKTDPSNTLYQIVLNTTQLQGINSALGGKYALGTDLDASGLSAFVPIGDASTPFTGVLDGLGHTISNLSINRPTAGYVGLVGFNTGEIRNVGLVGGAVSGHSRVGQLAGSNAGAINNAYATGDVSGAVGGFGVGGLVGVNVGTISDAFATGRVSGTASIGGLVGDSDGSVVNAHATGPVSGSFRVGGLVGVNGPNGSISGAFATGEVSAGPDVGGLVGQHAGSISNAYATGRVTGRLKFTGGLVGSIGSGGSVVNAYATGAVTGGGSDAGGLAGSNEGTISNAYATGSVASNQFRSGGLVGSGGGAVTNSYWDTQTSGRSTSAAGTGLTSAQMQSLAPFANAGWNIDNTGGTSSVWRIYDGQTAPLLRSFLTPLDLSGNSSSAAYSGSTQTLAISLPAGTNATLLLGGADAAASGVDAGLYTSAYYSNQQGFDLTAQAKLTITPKQVSASVTAQNKVYDASDAATASTSVAGLFARDGITVSTSAATFANKNVATGKTVTVGGISLAGTGVGNYELTSPTATTTANITPASISAVTGITANNKVYDGSTNVQLNTGAAAYTGKIGNDVLTVAVANGAFADKNVGTGKAVNISGITLGGADAGNYTLVDATASGTADITPKQVQLNGVTAFDKTYDGNRNAALNASTLNLVGLVSGDAVGLGSISGQFADKNAGVAKPVTITSVSLAGADAGNYSLAPVTVSPTATINKANAGAVVAITANSKVYDGNTTATLNTGNATVDGLVFGDVVTVTGATGTFANKNVADNKLVAISGISLGGADAGNYNAPASALPVLANITPKQVQVSGLTAQDKTYDGNKTASLNTGAVNLTGLVSGDAVGLGSATGSFADKNAGTSKTVAITGVTLAGADAGNYSVAPITTTTTAAINKANAGAVVGITANSKVYDGNTTAALNTGTATVDGLVLGDVVTVAGATGTFANKNVADNKLVAISGISLGGADAGNYNAPASALPVLANITPKQVQVSGLTAQDKTYDGNKTASLNSGAVNLAGLVSGDAVGLGSATGSFADKNAGANKTVAITGVTLAGADAGNYSVAPVTATTSASITPKTLTVAGTTAANKVYDGSRAATINTAAATLIGKIDGDTVAPAGGTGSFADKNVGTAKVVTVTGYSLTGTDALNYTVASSASTTANITPKALTVTGVTARDKGYDGNAHASFILGHAVLGGVVAGDSVALATLTGQFNNRTIGLFKPVTVTGSTLGGTDGGNYTLVNPNGLRANVLPNLNCLLDLFRCLVP